MNTTLLKKLRENVFFMTGAIYITWLLIGILWYKYENDWTWYNAFFYEVQAGFSIGFGNISEIDKDYMHAFTIVFVLCGSSIVSGAAGYFLTYALNEQSNLQPPNTHRWDTIPLTNNEGNVTLVSIGRCCWYKFKYLVGWYSGRSLVKTVSLFIFWMSLGVTYGMAFEKWNFIKSVFFAITSCATGGLLAPPCLDAKTNGLPSCDLGMTRAILSGLFVLIGVPSK
jgi:hypothetical protein